MIRETASHSPSIKRSLWLGLTNLIAIVSCQVFPVTFVLSQYGLDWITSVLFFACPIIAAYGFALAFSVQGQLLTQKRVTAFFINAAAFVVWLGVAWIVYGVARHNIGYDRVLLILGIQACIAAGFVHHAFTDVKAATSMQHR